MASFTTRILLRGSSSESDYDNLHLKMEQLGFSRTIESNDGIIYQLPSAEYNIVGSYTRDQVLGFAKDAVKVVRGKTAEILVTESAGRTWSNLKIV